MSNFPDSKAHGVNMGPIWGRQDPGGPHAGPMNFAIWVIIYNWPHENVILHSLFTNNYVIIYMFLV